MPAVNWFSARAWSWTPDAACALARALVTAPALILADEPTGNLDTQSTADVLAVLDRLNRAGRTIVVITHEADVAAHTRRRIRLVDGYVVEDVRTAVAA